MQNQKLCPYRPSHNSHPEEIPQRRATVTYADSRADELHLAELLQPLLHQAPRPVAQRLPPQPPAARVNGSEEKGATDQIHVILGHAPSKLGREYPLLHPQQQSMGKDEILLLSLLAIIPLSKNI